MTDREKIMRGAECCKYKPSANGCPEECPYLPEGHLTCGLDPFLNDVIALLKEQEAVRPRWTHPAVGVNVMMCGNCGIEIPVGKPNYCPWCGKAVKWK